MSALAYASPKPLLLSKLARRRLGRLIESPLSHLPPPQAGPQTAFLASTAEIVFYGGAAGGGKTLGLLLDFARHVDHPEYSGVIFRRTFPQVKNEGGLWDESSKLYSPIAEPKESTLEWKFPSGATIRFAHLNHEKNKYDWQGSQLVRIGFDEVTHFSKTQFFYLLSRNRSTSGIKPQIRATCNPDADSWVAEFIEWWLDEDGYAIPERSGIVRWFVQINNVLHWADDAQELRERFPGIEPKSFTFIPSKITDNKILLEKDPGYLANLMALHHVDQMRLLKGNWKIREEAGKFINRGWFEIVEALPDGAECRFWDFAATEAKAKGDDPDWTVGCKVRRVGSTFYVVDVVRLRANPGEVDRTVLNTAALDGRGCMVRWEQEGGSSGKFVSHDLIKKLAGYDCAGVPSSTSKLTRAKAFAVQAEAQNVKVLKAPWNNEFLAELHAVPDGAHDDQMDAVAGAFNALCVPEVKRHQPRSSRNW